MAKEIADSTLLDTWGSSGAKVEPDVGKIIEGWQLGEQPPHEYMNWLQNTFGSKLNHILKNGVAKWDDETEYLAGSSVQHNGNVWLCKTTNTKSEPTDANANWKRIITVEALTTVLNGYVATTGNQTIEGVKTFSSSPIVPTPTTSNQAVNKAYADLKVALADFIGTNQSLSENGYQKLPGGLIVQWGTAGSNADGQANFTLPVSFPNAVLSASATYFVNSRTPNFCTLFSSVWGKTTIAGLVFNASGGGVPGAIVKFIAIGY